MIYNDHMDHICDMIIINMIDFFNIIRDLCPRLISIGYKNKANRVLIRNKSMESLKKDRESIHFN